MTEEVLVAAPPEQFADAVQASVTQDAAREDRSEPYEDSFFVPLTQEDRNAFLAEIGALANEIFLAENAKREAAKAAQERIDAKYSRVHEIASIARRGTMERALTVVDVRVLSTNEMRIERVDTGEVVFRRALSSDERQGDLFPKDANGTSNGATAEASHVADAASSAPSEDNAGSEVMANTSASAGEGAAPEGVSPVAFGGLHDPTEVDRGDPITAAAENLGAAIAKDVAASVTKKRKRAKRNGA